MDEIKQELRQDNMAVKANAVNKLTYVSSSLLVVFYMVVCYLVIVVIFMYEYS